MTEEFLTELLNARLGIEGLQVTLPNITMLANSAIRFWSKYFPSMIRSAVVIDVTTPVYVFTNSVPDTISYVVDNVLGDVVTDYTYLPPALSGLPVGQYKVYCEKKVSKLEDLPDEIPPLLEDRIYSFYCRAIARNLSLGKIEIPLSINAADIKEEGDKLLEYTDLEIPKQQERK